MLLYESANFDERQSWPPTSRCRAGRPNFISGLESMPVRFSPTSPAGPR
jgi:hypothetical protein